MLKQSVFLFLVLVNFASYGQSTASPTTPKDCADSQQYACCYQNRYLATVGPFGNCWTYDPKRCSWITGYRCCEFCTPSYLDNMDGASLNVCTQNGYPRTTKVVGLGADRAMRVKAGDDNPCTD